MRLEELSKTGTLRKVKPNKQLIETALKKAHRDLRVSTTLIEQEEYDWAYTASYTAMPTAARALMNHMGYRPPSSDGHTAVVRILEAEEIDQDIRNFSTIIDRMRRTRHRVMYDEYDIITEKTAKQAHTWANKFVTTIEKTHKQNIRGEGCHPIPAPKKAPNNKPALKQPRSMLDI